MLLRLFVHLCPHQRSKRCKPTPTAGHAAFPVDPLTHFQSPFPIGFRTSSTAALNTKPLACQVFCENLFVHKLHICKKLPHPTKHLPALLAPPSAGTPAAQSFPTVAPVPKAPAGQPPASPSVTLLPPAPLSILKKAWFVLTLTQDVLCPCFCASCLALPPMPVAVDNGFPRIELNLGSNMTLDPSLVGLSMDASAAPSVPDVSSSIFG
jgi:hypothetical protein